MKENCISAIEGHWNVFFVWRRSNAIFVTWHWQYQPLSAVIEHNFILQVAKIAILSAEKYNRISMNFCGSFVSSEKAEILWYFVETLWYLQCEWINLSTLLSMPTVAKERCHCLCWHFWLVSRKIDPLYKGRKTLYRANFWNLPLELCIAG